jgi:hypothetical protein
MFEFEFPTGTTALPSPAMMSRLHSITSSASANKSGGTMKPQCLSCLQIDDKLEIGWLLDRQVGRLRAIKNWCYVSDGDLAKSANRTVAHQAVAIGVLILRVDRRNFVVRRQS